MRNLHYRLRRSSEYELTVCRGIAAFSNRTPSRYLPAKRGRIYLCLIWNTRKFKPLIFLRPLPHRLVLVLILLLLWKVKAVECHAMHDLHVLI